MKKEKKKNKGKKVGIVFQIISLIFLIAAIIVVILYKKDDQQNRDLYTDLRDRVIQSDGSFDIEGMTIDWEQFAGTDVVAWLWFGDDISYPVVQSDDNKYYLRRNYLGEYSSAGSLFMDCQNNSNLTDQNTIIYGHNMRAEHLMFSDIKFYLEPNYEGLDYFYLFLPDGTRHKYLLFSVNRITTSSATYNISFTEEEFLSWQQEMKESSVRETDIEPDTTKNIVTLSTCASIGSARGNRVVVLGMEDEIKQVQEPASWYNAETTTE